jgi:hypothetical protein
MSRCICKRSRASARRAGVIAQPDEQRHQTSHKRHEDPPRVLVGVFGCANGFAAAYHAVHALVSIVRRLSRTCDGGCKHGPLLAWSCRRQLMTCMVKEIACMEGSVLETDARPAGPDCETVATTISKRLMGDTGRMPLTKDAIKFGTFVVTSQVCSLSA